MRRNNELRFSRRRIDEIKKNNQQEDNLLPKGNTIARNQASKYANTITLIHTQIRH